MYILLSKRYCTKFELFTFDGKQNVELYDCVY